MFVISFVDFLTDSTTCDVTVMWLRFFYCAPLHVVSGNQIMSCQIVATSVQLCGVTLQFHTPEQDMAKGVLRFLVQHSGIHSHCLFMILTAQSLNHRFTYLLTISQ